MAKYLAIYNDTISDIEVNGFMLMSEKDVENYEELATSIGWSFTYKIGEYEVEYSSGEDLLTRIDFREISNEEHKSLKKIFSGAFGTFISEDFLEGLLDEEEEELDEEDDDDDYENPRYGDGDDDDDDDY